MEILDSLRYKTLFSTHQTRRGVKANVVLLAHVAQAKSFCTVRTTAPRLLMWRHGGTSRFFFFFVVAAMHMHEHVHSEHTAYMQSG